MLGWSIPGVPEAYQSFAKTALALLVGLWIVLRVWKRIRRFQRSRRPVRLHPKLEKYGIDQAEAARQRRELATEIVATSSSDRLAGYTILQQIEAVFVEGFRTPAEAVEALKAAAAAQGANAVIHVRQERTAAGKCSASGDAVRVTSGQSEE